jgi:glucose dehydrogenase
MPKETSSPLDAAAGKALWHFQMGGAVYAAPMAFAVDGKEYVAIAAGQCDIYIRFALD